MSTAIDCPACGARLKLPAALAPGTVLLCPMCHKAIRVPDADPAATGVTASAPARRPVALTDDEDDEPVRPRPRERQQPRKGGGLAMSVAIGIIVALLILIGGGLAVLLPILSPSVKPLPV